MCKKLDNIMFSNAKDCRNYQISINKRLRQDNYAIQHRPRNGIHGDRLVQHLRLAAEIVKLVRVAHYFHSLPIPSHSLVGLQLIHFEIYIIQLIYIYSFFVHCKYSKHSVPSSSSSSSSSSLSQT